MTESVAGAGAASGQGPGKPGQATESPEEKVLAHDTVETVVRAQLAKALGGVRGIVEAAVPTLMFAGSWLLTKDLKLSLIIGAAGALVLLAVRIVQRSTPQFVINSLIGIAIAAFFALRSGRAEDAFLPGILYNAAYAAGLTLSILVRWPLMGFLIGSVTGDPTGWRSDPGIVKLCSKLTWLLAIPCFLRVLVQYPIYLAAGPGWEAGVAILAGAKIALGWPLQVAAFGAMAWLLARGRTPIAGTATPST
ncbi:DUF3159 domain-containing protein [Rhizohabitans arisaemae]|uniref:DUF3159 domain-containing protein n=1 Tax=Rhizohabitans arisaemae TaxID=2720610 RepID=UPI0024B0B1CF|nr:DUF3159 domain-containing protein [Rhizohabitans arisaemae]